MAQREADRRTHLEEAVSTFITEKRLLPAFPRTQHLPYQPNASGDDGIASEAEANVIFRVPVNVEEKIDGASVGMALVDGQPLIRNRDHVLRKGYLKDTAAKVQFRPLWGWFYEHLACFEALAMHGALSVYGEWCLARHGLAYDTLPDWFIAYDLFDQEAERFISPVLARTWLEDAGFSLPRLHHQGYLPESNYALLGHWASQPGAWTETGMAEGVYVKTFDAQHVTGRFKLVRPGFVQGALWDPEHITKNRLDRQGQAR